MKESERLQQAISSITAQRIILGDSVVNTTVTALREQLDLLSRAPPRSSIQRTAQRKQITILFANVSGLSDIARSFPDINMLDIANLLWQQLDKAITIQGGTIDKHIGNAVMGLFGVPVASENDPERAVQAALAMRAALSNFVKEFNLERAELLASQQTLEEEQHEAAFPNLQLRVGINTGLVLLGGIGNGNEYTVIGDAVNIASRLERAAPADGILISRDTELLVHGIIDTEPLGPVEIRGRTDPVEVHLVLGAKPQRSFLTGRGVEGVETRLVGRGSEMQLLKQGLQTAVSSGTGLVTTISGEAGVGKSRLMQEFTNWMTSQNLEMPTFKGHSSQRMSQQPFSLIRNLLSDYFSIQHSDSSRLAEEKLIQGIRRLTGLSLKDSETRARTIAQLIGLDLAPKKPFLISPTETPQVRTRAYEYLFGLFKHITASSPATLIILEDIHWADESSLKLLDHLVKICGHSPLLVYCLTRPSLFVRRTKWGNEDLTDNGQAAVPQTTLHLQPLTKNQSRQLVTDILRKLTEIPADLCDLVVERAEGNPFYVEELIKVFIEDGLIFAETEQWLLRSSKWDNLRVPSTLTGVLQARLDRLSELERATLQRAAVIGRVFWDSAVIHMNEMAYEPLQASESVAALHALEKRELVFRRQTSVFTGTQTYYFKHAFLREVTYEGVLLRDRPLFHNQVADWLVNQSGDRIAEYAGLIAEHYELAGEKSKAAELYEIAALRAQDMSDMARALDFFGTSLFLLTEHSQNPAWQIRLQKRIGKLLVLQARLVEAAQTFMTMRYTAELDGDLTAQARAWNGLAEIHRRQADFDKMLEAATQAEQVAWLVNAERELARALLFKSRAFLHLGDFILAAGAANRALSINDGQRDATGIIYSLGQLSRIYLEFGQPDRAIHFLGELADQLDLQDLELEIIALNRAEQGYLYHQLEQYNKAAYELMCALDIYRELDRQKETAATLNQLGEIARLRGNPRAAIPLYREAIAIAETIGDTYGSLSYRTNLGGALSDHGLLELAENEFEAVINVAENIAFVVKWRFLSKVYRLVASNTLRKGETEKAFSSAQHALSLLPTHGETRGAGEVWRILGKISSKLPDSVSPIIVNGKKFEAGDCFAESIRLLRKESRGEFTQREQALTILSWAEDEIEHGDKQIGETLLTQGKAIAAKLEIELVD